MCQFGWAPFVSAQWALPSDVWVEPPGQEVPASIVDVGARVPDANARSLRDAARQATVPMPWLYADHDPSYSATAIRRYRAALEAAGGQGPLALFLDIGGNGHYLVGKPLFWRPALDACVQELGLVTAPPGEIHRPLPHAREEGTR